MPSTNPTDLLPVILDSWDRNNRILVNLLQAIPPEFLSARAAAGSPTVAQIFTHVHYVRLVFLSEDAPQFAIPLPTREWVREASPGEGSRDRLAAELEKSSAAVRNAVENLIRSGQPTQQHFDHPLLYLQHMIWHEGYHHGQIKLALKIAGHPLDDEQIGPLTWSLFINKTSQ